MTNIFTKHPAEVGETYFQHFRAGIEVVGRLAVATHCQLLHVVFPFIKPPFGNDLHTLIKELNKLTPEARLEREAEKENRHLDEALDGLSGDHIDEYEEAIDLYTTYGGD